MILESLHAKAKCAFSILLVAYDYAIDVQVDPWQFAVQVSELRSLGLSLSDLRWLVLKGFAIHGQECTLPGDSTRSFRILPYASLVFSEGICVALSSHGASELRRHCDESMRSETSFSVSDSAAAAQSVLQTPSAAPRTVPIWKKEIRELWYRDQLIKRFRVPADSQERILDAFQEDKWPEWIDDPLPPKNGADSRRRLREAIKSLNRNRAATALRFHSNGDGIRIHWECE
ncbi:hypothetical protein [Planctomyces sp. SH-PL14]|uniref:hypothetical protein n=1 Tax=Planctomyces sp. SH-PL14 TaxID=1632864 RepID=UPI0012E98D4A|nr:hypothetical protein [Planctomyces sp. SH-PL14]